jgi:hypothetical protein
VGLLGGELVGGGGEAEKNRIDGVGDRGRRREGGMEERREGEKEGKRKNTLVEERNHREAGNPKFSVFQRNRHKVPLFEEEQCGLE